MKVDNIDKFGHCILCHRNLLKNVALSGKIEPCFDPDKDEAWLKLNTGSMMSISVCKKCKSNTDFESIDNKKKVLEAVNNGWELEMDLMLKNKEKFPEFNEEKRNKLKQLYSSITDFIYDKEFKVT